MDLYAFFQSEVKPTIGCTEPGAVAYAAAVAARHLPTQPEGIRLEMSVAIYKNGRSVGIPGTNGLRGLTLACVLGALGGNPDKGLMALEDIPAATVEQAQAFIDAGKMAEEVVQGTPSMWARVTLSGGGHTVSCTVARKHDHVERLVADGAVLVDQPLEAQSGGTDWTDELTAMHFEELWNLALGIDDAIVRQMLEGARMNMAILDHAGTEQAGIGIGSALAKHNGHGSLSEKIGRRKAIMIAAMLALPVIPLWAFASGSLALGAGAFLMQFMVQGAWGVIPTWLNELVPANTRAVLPGFVYQLGNLLASVNATLQASIAQHHGHNYGLAMALVAGTVAIVITVLTFFGREGRVIQSAGAGHHQPLSTSR